MIPKNSVLSKMSCLVVARKAWKSFTTKLRRKFRKIHFDPHHIIKKPNRSTKLKLTHQSSSSLTLKKSSHSYNSRSRTKHHHKLFTRVLRQRKYYPFKKQQPPFYVPPPPIFIDDLFRFRAAELANSQLESAKRSKTESDDPSTSFSTSSKAIKAANSKGDKYPNPITKDGIRISDQGNQYAEPETSLNHRIHPSQIRNSLASGIDARAEEFISRFKAELQFQETVARYL